MKTPSKETIVQNFKNGDKEAFRHLFELLYPAMCIFARKYLKDSVDAEDIAQEVFIELWNHKTKFQSLEQVKSFLYLSVKNRCLNFIKHLQVKEKYAQTTEMDHEASFEERVIETEVIHQLNQAIVSLPEQQRQVILLSLQGLKNEEIASDMGLSINTIKLYKKIAYEQLRNKVGEIISVFILI